MGQLEGVTEFLAVVDRGSFTAASRVLGVSVAHVSRMVSRLEERLDTRLVERTTRSVRPTESGRLVYARAKALFEQFDELVDEVQHQQRELRGVVRVAAGGAYGERVVAPSLVRFAASHPGIVIDLVMSDARVDLVSEGIDLAVRLGHLPDTALVARRITFRRFVLCASPAYLAEAPALGSLADLGGHAGVVSPLVPWRLQSSSGEPVPQPVARFVSNNIPALVEAALAGLGIAWLAEVHVRDHLAQGRLVPLLPETQSEPAPVWLVYPSRVRQPRRVRAVMDWLVEEIGRSSA
jgi:DNA-binding transcriptional LysR family regulator